MPIQICAQPFRAENKVQICALKLSDLYNGDSSLGH